MVLFQNVSVNTSIITLIAIALDRYQAILYPFSKKSSKRETKAAAAKESSGSRGGAAKRSRAASRAPKAEPAETEGIGMLIAIAIGAILMLFACFTVLDAATAHDRDPTAMSGWVANIVRDMFFSKS